MPQELRSIGAVSCAKVLAVLYGVVGILIGAVFSLIFLAAGGGGAFAGMGAQAGPLKFMLGVGSIVFFPICYALIGAIGGLIAASVYNLVAKYIGGIEIEIGS